MPLAPPVCLDASEGGGQLFRTALVLSLVTGRAVQVERLRGAGVAAGLGPAQLAYLRSAQAISGARLHGAEPGSERVLFEPGPLRQGAYLLDVGEAGSIPLALQLLGPALGLVGAESTITLRGQTELEGSPSYHYLSLIWVPVLRALGWRLDFELKAAGHGPGGAGEVKATVGVAGPAVGFEQRARGTLREVRVLSTVSNVPFERATRQSAGALRRLRESGICAEAENIPVPAPRSSGSTCLVAGIFERGRAGFGVRAAGSEVDAERVGEEAAAAFVDFMESRGAIDPYLADQLLVPLAIGAAGLRGAERPISRFTTSRLTGNLLSTASVIHQFLDVEVAVLAGAGSEAEVRVAPRGESLLSRVKARGTDQRPES